MGGHQFYPDPYTTHREYFRHAKIPIPEGAEDVKECGCYIIKDVQESDRVWVTYTTINTYHYRCKTHTMEECKT